MNDTARPYTLLTDLAPDADGSPSCAWVVVDDRFDVAIAAAADPYVAGALADHLNAHPMDAQTTAEALGIRSEHRGVFDYAHADARALTQAVDGLTSGFHREHTHTGGTPSASAHARTVTLYPRTTSDDCEAYALTDAGLEALERVVVGPTPSRWRRMMRALRRALVDSAAAGVVAPAVWR